MPLVVIVCVLGSSVRMMRSRMFVIGVHDHRLPVMLPVPLVHRFAIVMFFRRFSALMLTMLL